MLVNGGVILRSTGQTSRSLGMKMYIHHARLSEM